MYWSQPEILLYDPDPKARISYPDFVEEKGRYFITETQKTIARVHEIDAGLLEGVWNQFDRKVVARNGLKLEWKGGTPTVTMPRLPDLREGGGFSIDMWVKFRELSEGQTLLDTRISGGKGMALTTSDRFTLRLTLNDGKTPSAWDSDPGTHAGTLRTDEWQHIAVIVDGGPKIITFVIDGVLNDGGAARQYGWGRFDPALSDVNGATNVTRGAGVIRRIESDACLRPLSTHVGSGRELEGTIAKLRRRLDPTCRLGNAGGSRIHRNVIQIVP